MRQTVSLNRKWAFVMDGGSVPRDVPSPAYYVNLPHTWNAIDGQDGGNDYYRGLCYYVKRLPREEIPQGERLVLEFCGANASADVYVNGEHVGRHDGGYSTFRVDATQAIGSSGDPLIVVGVDNGVSESVYPQMADFTFYGGLYRDVNLIAVPKAHFDLLYEGGPGIAVTPVMEKDDARVAIQVWLQDAAPGQRLRYTIVDARGETVAEKTAPAEETRFETVIAKAHRWHGRRDPYLYTARVALLEGNEEMDAVSARFGCRSFEIDPERGFILNGESYPLRGVSRHQDRWGIGNALLPEHHREDMALIEEVGATTIRLAHYQHDQAFYDLCDERGMVVWAEIPYISKHMPGGEENALSQMRELIVQNINHPSIVVWGLSNEITMNGGDEKALLALHRRLNDLCHEMDKTRLTTMAVVSMCDIRAPYIQIPDTVAYNHYFGWYGGDVSMNGPWLDEFHKTFPKLPIGLSEYGCEALDWHASDPVQGDYTEEYQAAYHEEMIRQIAQRPYLWATYVWNMFDFGADARAEGGENGQNHKGLVTFDRRYRKDAFYAYKAWLSDEPFVHLCAKRYVDRVEPVTRVKVYSNQPEVELFVNGRSAGRQRREDHFFVFEVRNEGESTLTAVAGDCRDESRIRKVETFNERYRLRERGAVLNWFDVSERKGFYSLMDKVGDIRRSGKGEALLKAYFFDRAGKEKDGKDGKSEKSGGFELKEGMAEMMNGFTALRLSSMLPMMGVELGKEELLELNEKLNQVEKE
ncbi:MAG: glycoside hydrolase family 2 TIM barrel-domain containing protein [Clostridia bacterium]|nr:glycoside hydrolase family 2 TIM barrel-domain containing protein [Clostridia bacterium]